MGPKSMVSQNRGEPPPLLPMLKQGSLFNLTFDEDHNFCYDVKATPMLIDGFSMQQHMQDSSSSSSSSNIYPVLQNNKTADVTISHKYCDDIWSDIIQQEGIAEKHTRLAETADLDFTLHGGAGIGTQASCKLEPDLGPLLAASQYPCQAEWFLHQFGADHEKQELQQHMGFIGSGFPVLGNAIMDTGLSNELAVVSMALPRPNSNLQPVNERKRASEDVDKNNERKQMRMIKNRESAARSRARKQAYMNSLQDSVLKLSEVNKQLKKQLEVEKILQPKAAPVRGYEFRRSSSAHF